VLDVLNQSEEDPEKVLLKVRQGKPEYSDVSRNTVMFGAASKK
jgi:hypothetical protein